MPSKLRLQRIADRIQQDLAVLVIQKVNDPRLAGITITGVKVDRELAFADIFVSAVEVRAGLKKLSQDWSMPQVSCGMRYLNRSSCECSLVSGFIGIQRPNMPIISNNYWLLYGNNPRQLR